MAIDWATEAVRAARAAAAIVSRDRDRFRADIARLFPGLNNSNGAVGVFSLDTRTMTNGIHTISWVVRDNAGNAQGIGSRYFTVQNP